jgi:hypothetical protein
MTLVGRLFNATPWIPWIPSAVLVALISWGSSSPLPDFPSRQLYIRAALLVAALGFCFVYDDAAAETTLLVGGRGMDPTFILNDEVLNPFPIGRLLLEASTLATWGLAIAAVISKRWDEEPGKLASAGLLTLYAVSWAIPEQWKPWANPNDPRWETALPWWWVALVIGLLVVVAFSWDSRVGWRLRLGSRRGESSGLSVRESSYSMTSGE